MSDIRVASRYAKSLIQLSNELNVLDEIKQDMTLIKNTCDNSKELSALLRSPLVNPDKKLKILKEIFNNKFNKVTDTFIELITKKKREPLLREIANQFIIKFKVHRNIQIATVTTAIPLNDEFRKEIPKMIVSAMDGDATIELVENIDESLIGGMILRLGDQQLDDSIRKKIRKLEMEFSNNPYVKKI